MTATRLTPKCSAIVCISLRQSLAPTSEQSEMRIRVTHIPEMLASGASRAEILEDYPYLVDAEITAALDYAARQINHQVLRVA